MTIGAPSRTKASAAAWVGLPADGFVFCNFNNAYKFTPDSFAAWMRILAAVPGSVLGAAASQCFAAANLHAGRAPGRGAGTAGVPRRTGRPSATWRETGRPVSRQFPTTPTPHASDALWPGVPLLTWRGTAFPGRVARSLLRESRPAGTGRANGPLHSKSRPDRAGAVAGPTGRLWRNPGPQPPPPRRCSIRRCSRAVPEAAYAPDVGDAQAGAPPPNLR